MKRLSSLVAASLILAMGVTAQAQIPYYFDVNDDAAGSGVGSTIPDQAIVAWNTTGIGWNTINADGTQASSGLNVAWTNGNDAVFSAGTDASTPGLDPKGTTFAFNIAAGIQSRNSIVEEGIVQVFTGSWDATNQILVKPGAAIRSASSSQFPAGSGVAGGGNRITLQGTSIADAGEMEARNTGAAGSMFNSGGSTAREIEIDGFGRISYDNATSTVNNPDDGVNIMASNFVTGVGGTPTNGGAGTLIKSGPDQVGMAVKEISPGVGNWTLTSFKKLRVEQGGFRLRSGTVGGVTAIDERLFGAVPLSELPDAITLDGGGIGSNANITLSALRGVTFSNSAGNNLGVLAGDASLGGGYWDSGATQGMTMPGPISGSGSMYIGDPTSTAANVPTFTLSHANNVNTFSGNLIGVKGGLTLNSSLKVNGLKDVAGFTQNPTNIATITIASGKTLTVGVSGGGGTWSRAIGGAGGFTKMGAGTETLTVASTYTGSTTVQGGTLSITNAYLADAADVLLSTGSFFNLNTSAATDIIHSLFIDSVLQSAGIWGAIGSGAAHESALITGSGFLNASVGPVACAPGDFNCDGHVDAGDFVSIRKSDPTLLTAPAIAAYNAWRTNYGNPPGSGTGLSGGAVPEPASLGLLVIGLAAFGLGRRNRVA